MRIDFGFTRLIAAKALAVDLVNLALRKTVVRKKNVVIILEPKGARAINDRLEVGVFVIELADG